MSDKFYKIMFLVAAWHNFIGGALFALLGDWIYRYEGLSPPRPGIHYKTWIGLIFVFGVMYYMVYVDIYSSKSLVVIGILGKFVSSVPMLYGLIFIPERVPGLFVVPVATDMTFGFLFLAFYIHANKSKRWGHANW